MKKKKVLDTKYTKKAQTKPNKPFLFLILVHKHIIKVTPWSHSTPRLPEKTAVSCRYTHKDQWS